MYRNEGIHVVIQNTHAQRQRQRQREGVPPMLAASRSISMPRPSLSMVPVANKTRGKNHRMIMHRPAQTGTDRNRRKAMKKLRNN